MGKLKIKKKLIVISLLAVLIIGLALVGVCFYFKNKATDNTKTSDSSKTTTKQYNLESTDIYGIAYQTAKDKGYNAGQSYLDGQLKQASDSESKSYIYTYKSNLIMTDPSGDYKQALEFANKAEELYPSTTSILTVAIIDEKLNNKTEALKNYKLYLERMKKFLDSYSGDFKSTYQRSYDNYKTYVEKLEAAK